ncbi:MULTISPECIES: hypothetical protein [Stenotrophomonas]|uniref:hypothetical protein n=1 Tax=Stenotrophomonas TaxID=40323 RepID=UPI00201D05E5|nr:MULTISPECIES: hypothetical protein [Stenotrophomonas]MBN5025817.1 hypothetical protein [Stenotrophomonas maltophilia]MDH1272656.1 hypothetical protein [Stenotrophomonas sp. GD03937]MDH1484730.1 hypothetical protein [Stenotrophomonas sp. GD03712]UQY97650.1 hypothetical protein LZ605_09925 [Stenotrophomonas maltophilia]WON69880.1 hypothetical protein RWT08_05950 [Stenotrophomonas maltophilia]
MEHINAEEARRISEEAAARGSHSELRDEVYLQIKSQAGIGATSLAFARQAKYSAASYAALGEELKKDGYAFAEVMEGMYEVNWRAK